MTIGSAASRPGHEPAAPLPPFHPFESDAGLSVEPDTLSKGAEGENEIRYPTAPPSVSWPRVFPQL